VIETRIEHEIVIAKLTDDLSIYDAQFLINTVTVSKATSILLDMKEVDNVSGTTIIGFFTFLTSEWDSKIHVAGAPQHCKRIINIMGMAQFCHFHNTVEDGIATLSHF